MDPPYRSDTALVSEMGYLRPQGRAVALAQGHAAPFRGPISFVYLGFTERA
jgi:hypothetical protein